MASPHDVGVTGTNKLITVMNSVDKTVVSHAVAEFYCAHILYFIHTASPALMM